MPVSDTQLELVFRYFDGDLSEEEERQFMQQLQQNIELQQAFDQQVLMQQLQLRESVEPIVSVDTKSADDFLKRVTGVMEAKHTSAIEKHIPVLKRKTTWMAAAAAILVCVLAISIYLINRKNQNNQVVKVPGNDSVAQKSRTTPKQLQNVPVPEPEVSLQQLYADNNIPFSNNGLNIPPPAMMYESYYRQGDYNKLANLPESVLETKGNTDPAEDAEVANYFHFYKALAALQINDTATARTLLKKLLKNDINKTELHNYVKWYLLMVYLKTNNKADALQTARLIIADKKNIYYNKALEIKQKLGN